MKTTQYFRDQVLRKRPYIRPEWCSRVLDKPIAILRQPDGRLQFWGLVPELENRVLRVLTPEDKTTVHNAFLDRRFRTHPSRRRSGK